MITFGGRKNKRGEKSMRIKGNNLKKFSMKWRFRLDHARAVFGLLTFALLLSVGYIEYITFLDKLGIWGVVILTAFIFIIFAIGGYLYDKVLKLWESHTTVGVERSPYTYVPNPKEYIRTNALDYLMVYLLYKNSETKEEAILFEKMLDDYYQLNPATEEYIEKSNEIKRLSDKFVKQLKEKMKDDQ